jgi:hypothetical protein
VLLGVIPRQVLLQFKLLYGLYQMRLSRIRLYHIELYHMRLSWVKLS